MSYTCLLLQLTEVNNSKVMNKTLTNKNIKDPSKSKSVYFLANQLPYLWKRRAHRSHVYKTMKIEKNISTGI